MHDIAINDLTRWNGLLGILVLLVAVVTILMVKDDGLVAVVTILMVKDDGRLEVIRL